MADKPVFLDIWIVDSNTVYKEVPFVVVTDWLQQGRLLDSDRVKLSGTADWAVLGDYGDLQAFLPKPELNRPDDVAEALEPLELEFQTQKTLEEEDEEVDMIPLIDVSLVLLVFFMLTASTAAMSSSVPVPNSEYGLTSDNPDAIRIDITQKEGVILYSLGMGDKPPGEGESDLVDQATLLDRLKIRLDRITGPPPEVIINADKDLKARIPAEMSAALRNNRFKDKIKVSYYGTSGKAE